MQSNVGLPRDTLVNSGVNKSLGVISGIGGNVWWGLFSSVLREAVHLLERT